MRICKVKCLKEEKSLQSIAIAIHIGSGSRVIRQSDNKEIVISAWPNVSDIYKLMNDDFEIISPNEWIVFIPKWSRPVCRSGDDLIDFLNSEGCREEIKQIDFEIRTQLVTLGVLTNSENGTTVDITKLQEFCKNKNSVQIIDKINYDFVYEPLWRPSKNILCMAVNFYSHRDEKPKTGDSSTADMKPEPKLFTKCWRTMTGSHGDLYLEFKESLEQDWEVEIGVVIGKKCKNVKKENARDVILGFVVLNDITARDLQFRYGQFYKGKSLDNSLPVSCFIVTPDEFEINCSEDEKIINNLKMICSVNGIIKQNGKPEDMIRNIDEIIEFATSGQTLDPGDLIATGTPSGVGWARNPKEFLKESDEIITAVENVGIMKHKILRSSENIIM